MFEQMRANVGKLLKGIDRSEPGRRESGAARGWSVLGLPWVGFSSLRGEMFKENSIASV